MIFNRRLSRQSGAHGPAVLAVIIALVLPVAAACSVSGPTTASGGGASTSWGQVTPVPGLSGLSAAGGGDASAVSCPSTGNCTVGGTYPGGPPGQGQAFVASEQGGQWGGAIKIPGLDGLDVGGVVKVAALSCSSAGNCAAGGQYLDGSHQNQAFLVTERSGQWGGAIQVPGAAGLNARSAWITALSCASPGNCAAGGGYSDGHGPGHAFVLSEQNGQWGAAVRVPGTASGVSYVNAVSCGSPANCAAGGFADDPHGHSQAFVTSEHGGQWGAAVDVLARAGLNAGGSAWVDSLSCPGAGTCAAGGSYQDGDEHYQVFVASERGGRWGTALEVPGTASLNAGGQPRVSSVSCPSAGNCSAGGAYLDGSGNRHAFVASERGAQWDGAIEVPGTGARAYVTSLSCGSAGNCAADGDFVDSSHHLQPFVANEQSGQWNGAIEVPGIAAQDASTPGHTGQAQAGPVSCAGSGYCVAAG